ncbi:MAG: threonyl-tRNA synthetase editing domain-containing protein [bacterium]|nr:threonyl-tRNA synthetase editing domain-containing protein [bacterium]MDT8396813.1 threonyl-tRNA synthetase editing domain-containing protein [bacterium]
MKLLLFYMPSFYYSTHAKSLPSAPDVQEEREITGCVVALVQAEEDDPGKGKKVLDKLLKNAKWLCGKFQTKKVVLHFFSHLSESRADPEYARDILVRAAERLESAGYEAHLTPFGYFCEMKLHIGGESLAKVYKEF